MIPWFAPFAVTQLFLNGMLVVAVEAALTLATGPRQSKFQMHYGCSQMLNGKSRVPPP